MSIVPTSLVGLIQAAALALYCWAVSLILFNPDFYSRANPTTGAIFFLLLFIGSALVSAALALGYPGYLARRVRWREALGIVGATVVWLALFLGALALVIFQPL